MMGNPAVAGVLLQDLSLPHAATALRAWLFRAAAEELTYADFLEGLLTEELAGRWRDESKQ